MNAYEACVCIVGKVGFPGVQGGPKRSCDK